VGVIDPQAVPVRVVLEYSVAVLAEQGELGPRVVRLAWEVD
jgi:hypothetical protein